MTLSQQRRTVAVASMVVFAIGTVKRVQAGESFSTDAARFYVGVGVAFGFCSFFTDLGLEIGAGFALLIMIAAFLAEGFDVFNFITKRSRSVKRLTPGSKRGQPLTQAQKDAAIRSVGPGSAFYHQLQQAR